ncbi:hypothetical protein [Halalkalibaculum sp. DA384]|uniref:hypothetical protein n=1 Tax=Halalkalibaculum sp. DA384 TaxID=3373606 RepID=UPI00375506BC
MSYLYLLLSAGCSLLLVHLMKAGESRDQRMLNTFAVNYLVAALVAFSIGGLPSLEANLELLTNPGFLFVVATGSIFIVNFLVYSKSIHLNGIGISVTAMRLSLLVPVLVSVLLYRESVTAATVLGLILVFVALGLLIPRKRTIRFKKIDAAWLLIVIFLLTGLADASLKVYEEDFSLQFNELTFMGMVFSVAFLVGLILMFVQKGPALKKGEVVTGVLIGIPNLYSTVFLIYALHQIDGAIAYPVVNILNVAGGTLLGLWIWDDTVTKLQWWGIAAALAAILLLI